MDVDVEQSVDESVHDEHDNSSRDNEVAFNLSQCDRDSMDEEGL